MAYLMYGITAGTLSKNESLLRTGTGACPYDERLSQLAPIHQ